MKEAAQSVEMGNECRPRGPFSAHDEQGGEAGSSSKKTETQPSSCPSPAHHGTLCVSSVILHPQASQTIGILILSPLFLSEILNAKGMVTV